MPAAGVQVEHREMPIVAPRVEARQPRLSGRIESRRRDLGIAD